MQRFYNLLALIILFFWQDEYLFAQDSLQTKEIRQYAAFIDSLIETDDPLLITRGIAEGLVSMEITVTQKSANADKIETVKTQRSGGYSKTTYMSPGFDTAYKIIYHDNLDKNFYLAFYYRQEILLFAQLRYEENGVGKIFYAREEYYLDGGLLDKIETTGKISEEYERRVFINLYQQGKDHYKEFLEKRKK